MVFWAVFAQNRGKRAIFSGSKGEKWAKKDTDPENILKKIFILLVRSVFLRK